jgi:hypothetical protein
MQWPLFPRRNPAYRQDLRHTFAAFAVRIETVYALALRLTLAPLIVLLASLVQRQAGPRRGGRVIGLPLTTGPFLAVLCLQYGRGMAAQAAVGVVAGQLVVVGFCLAYAHLAQAQVRPLWALVGALAAGAVAGIALAPVRPLWIATAAVLAVVAIGLATFPTTASPSQASTSETKWTRQTVVRMAVTGAIVAGLATGARLLGPYLAGVLSSAPVILSVLVPATHRSAGAPAAAELLRGTLASLPGAVVFITVLAYTLESAGAPAGFGLAAAALVAVAALPWTRLPHLLGTSGTPSRR